MYQDGMNNSVLRFYDNEFPLLMPRWGYVVSAFVLFVIGFLGFFLNLMVILLMFKDRQLWTPLNIILFNLVCSDFSVSVLGNPLTLISALFHRWVFGRTMCVLYGFFMALLGITSITTLMVLAFERYMLVSRPLRVRQLSSRGAAFSIIFIWSYSLALTTPPLFGWGNYVNEAANISCSVNWHEQSTNSLTYILYLFAMGQIVPTSVIAFSYVNIVRTMKQNSQRLGRESRAEAKVTAMVFIMIIAFTVAWTPYSVFALLEQFATQGIVSPGAGVIPALVAKSSICYNPLIYVGMNTQFRQSIKRLFSAHNRSGMSQTERANDNTLVSPTNRVSRGDDTIVKYNTELIINTRKQINSTDKEINPNGIYEQYNEKDNNHELNKIKKERHIKATGNPEYSDVTVLEDDSSNDKEKLDNFEESCYTNSNNSPILTIIDSERLVYSKTPLLNKNFNNRDVNEDVYGNKGFEDYPSDKSNEKQKESNAKKLKQSYSLDLSKVPNETPKRKFSIETKIDERNDSGFWKNVVIFSKFKNRRQSKKSHDDLKTYININKTDNDDENL